MEVQEAVDSVVHGLLATLSPKMHSKSPQSDSTTSGTLNNGNNDQAEVVENNTSFGFQPLISLSRDYLARLLFWFVCLFPSALVNFRIKHFEWYYCIMFDFCVSLIPIRCMLLGHFIRGLEYRFELVQLLALTGHMDGTLLS